MYVYPNFKSKKASQGDIVKTFDDYGPRTSYDHDPRNAPDDREWSELDRAEKVARLTSAFESGDLSIDELIADRVADADRTAYLLLALRTIVKLTDGSQPKDYPGALMVAHYAIAKATARAAV